MELAGYQIHKSIGEGGMAEVYLGTQQSFGRKVAIKVLDDEKAGDADYARRFIREAKLVAGLAHPHIIPVYDVGQNNGHIYMSMEYLSGGDLAQWIQRGLLPEEALIILEQIALALQFSHDKSIIHRDVKPENIMFREDNSAVLMDFGIARSQQDKSQLTQENTVVGTPKYMSPEQLMGLRVDGRCDLYALGAVFFEMLTRHAPFDADDFCDLSMKHLNEPVPQLPPLLQVYQPLLEKMMAKKVEQRFQSGRELAKAVVTLRKQLVNEALKPKPAKTAKKIKPETPAGKSEPQLEPLCNKPANRAKLVDTKGTGFHFNETSSGIGPFKKFALVCDIVTPDAHTFSIQFSAITTRLLEWHDQRKGKSKGVIFNVTVDKVAFDKVKQTIAYVCQNEGPYDFMNKLKVDVTLSDQFGELIEEYRV